MRPVEPLSLAELIQTLEAGINDVVPVAAAVFFLATLESRVKRRRALKAIHELRVMVLHSGAPLAPPPSE